MSKSAQSNSTQQTGFGLRFVVDIKKPLKEFDTTGGTAFEVVDTEDPGAKLYALVQNQKIPIRDTVYRKLKSKPVANIVCPVDQGIAYLNIGNPSQKMVTIFNKPTGGPLMDHEGKLHPRVTTSKLRQHIILSALKGLAALHRRKLTHRSILPSAMYFATPDSDEIYIGECCSRPAGYEHPFIAEALEFAFADSTARGEGTPASDFFQLGAAFSSLCHREMLWQRGMRDGAGMSRVNQGSYRAFSHGKDIPGALGNLVRGLMADELEERWNSSDILDWFEGVSVTKRTAMQTKSMRAATVFKGVSYVDRRLLADAFGQNPVEAAAFLRKQDFQTWAHVSLGEEQSLGRVEQLLGLSSTNLGFSSDNRAEDFRLVAKFCLFLDPTGPIRFKNISFYLGGVPAMLSKAFSEDDRETISAILEVLNPKLLGTFGAIMEDNAREYMDQVDKLSRVRRFADSKQLGQGMERVLYELNPLLPCISPRFKQFWVASTADMLRSLDKIADTVNSRVMMTDRHITAFLAARGEGLERMFNGINAAQNDPARFSLLVTDLFGFLQKSAGLGSLPKLTNKLVEGLAPALRVLKHKKRKEQVQNLLEKVKKGGDITRLTNEVNMTKIAAEDAREFARAKHLVAKLERERVKLSKKIEPSDPSALDKGFRLGWWIAFIVFVGTIFMSISG